MTRHIHAPCLRAVQRLQSWLWHSACPRVSMMGLAALVGAAGLLLSLVLLQAGLDSMALRYPLALAGAYVLFLLGAWWRGAGLAGAPALGAVWRRATLPVCITGVLLAGAGAALGAWAPGARSVGEALGLPAGAAAHTAESAGDEYRGRDVGGRNFTFN